MSRREPQTVVAVDLGASSGRVMTAHIGPQTLELTEAARFDNVPVQVVGRLYWDMLRLFRGVVEGIRTAADSGPIASIGIDSWAVDYGLLDGDGQLIGNPVHYRDQHVSGVIDAVLDQVSAAELYRVTGVQFQQFNTVFRLADGGAAARPAAATLLLVPDLIAYWLTGRTGSELTNVSTTQLYDIRRRRWSTELMDRLGIPAGLFGDIRRPGETIGPLLPEVAEATGLPPTAPVTAVGSHDTASAVAAVPADGPRFGYISCGTWSLVGVELDRPILTDESRAANFTNEIGVDGTIRYLRNIAGLWLLQECRRIWRRDGMAADIDALVGNAAAQPGPAVIVDPDAPLFRPPGDMPARIAAYCRHTGQPVPPTPAATVRCVLDSLAVAHRLAIDEARRLSGHDIDVLHIVGGGARNELLCQLTADACGLPVVAGPAEATALGNALMQGRALGLVDDDLAGMRALVRGTQPLRRYTPAGDERAWLAAAERLLAARRAPPVSDDLAEVASR